MSFNINGINAYGINNSFGNSKTFSNVKTNKLQNSLENINNASDEELMEVCKEFETYMLEQVIKSMESTIGKDEEESSTSYMDMFGDNLTNSYAKSTYKSNSVLVQFLNTFYFFVYCLYIGKYQF